MGYKDVRFAEKSKFLITGGAGFIGSNLCEALLEMGYYVRCLDNFSTGKCENIEPFLQSENFELIEGDIRNFDVCMQACDGIDYVSHQAAWGSVPRSIAMPLVYEEINIKGTVNMMEAARQNGVKKFVYASSSSVYGDEPNLPKHEDRVGKVLSPYKGILKGILPSIVIAMIMGIVIKILVPHSGWIGFMFICAVMVAVYAVSMYIKGFNQYEKQMVKSILNKVKHTTAKA